MKQAVWLIDQLILQGVTQFCIAPGSRSAPLAIAAASHPKAQTTVHYDERGMGFYALGYAKGAKKPAAVITTSGTAVANLLPSAMEAYHSETPLLLLTADRPHELRYSGANQTTDQTKLFSNAIRFQMDLSPHLNESSIRSIAAQAVFAALQNPQGPVHLNCPFQEPLFDPTAQFSFGKPISFSFPQLKADPIRTEAKRGVILLGPVPDPRPVIELAERLKWPLFADLLSNARSFPSDEQILHFDYLIRVENGPKPDFILHFGERFISKHILEWTKGTPFLHVSASPILQDSARRNTMRVQSDIGPFCKTFEAKSDPSWLHSWHQLDKLAHDLIEEHFAALPFTEAHAIRSLPSKYPIFFANSMPIRNADHFYFPKNCPKIFANRGLSGIDGNIATIAGITDSLKSPLVAFVGDQTALHDLNSLPLINANKILLVISNNFGGAIFDYLPVSKSPHLDKFFTASHSWNFEGAAKMFNIPYLRTEKELKDLPEHGIIELITDRRENHLFQKGLIAKLQNLAACV